MGGKMPDYAPTRRQGSGCQTFSSSGPVRPTTLAAQPRRTAASVRIVDRVLTAACTSRAPSPSSRARSRSCKGRSTRRWSSEATTPPGYRSTPAGVVSVRLFDVGFKDTAYPFLLFISQAETEAVLNEHLAGHGVRVERGVELVGFEARGRGHLHAPSRDREGSSGSMRVPRRLRRRPQQRPPRRRDPVRRRRLPADVRARRPRGRR